MKHAIRRWVRRNVPTKTLVFVIDHPRAIDQVIDYFGERLAPTMAVAGPRRES